MKAPLFGMGGKEFIYLGPRRGTRVPPPNRVHLIAETAAAKRMAPVGFLALRQRQHERAVKDIAGSRAYRPP